MPKSPVIFVFTCQKFQLFLYFSTKMPIIHLHAQNASYFRNYMPKMHVISWFSWQKWHSDSFSSPNFPVFPYFTAILLVKWYNLGQKMYQFLSLFLCPQELSGSGFLFRNVWTWACLCFCVWFGGRWPGGRAYIWMYVCFRVAWEREEKRESERKLSAVSSRTLGTWSCRQVWVSTFNPRRCRGPVTVPAEV